MDLILLLKEGKAERCRVGRSSPPRRSYPQLSRGVVVGVDPLSQAPVLHGDALQEVVVHVEANAQREERELLPHHSLHVLLDGAELDLSCRERNPQVSVKKKKKSSSNAS